MSKKRNHKLVIGWHEWCGLPELNVPAILAKVDTGAKTSAIHAFDITPFERDGKEWVKFSIHPIQRYRTPKVQAQARVIAKRNVTSSNGNTEERYVISTTLTLGGQEFDTELTLANRDDMGFRMLIGRQALARRFLVDSGKCLMLGKVDPSIHYELQDI